jgi:hypothetical protein
MMVREPHMYASDHFSSSQILVQGTLPLCCQDCQKADQAVITPHPCVSYTATETSAGSSVARDVSLIFTYLQPASTDCGSTPHGELSRPLGWHSNPNSCTHTLSWALLLSRVPQYFYVLGVCVQDPTRYLSLDACRAPSTDHRR